MMEKRNSMIGTILKPWLYSAITAGCGVLELFLGVRTNSNNGSIITKLSVANQKLSM